MKQADIDAMRTEHKPVSMIPRTQGVDVRCLSPQHPEGGIPWPCQTIQVIHHVDTVARRADVAAGRVMRDTGLLWVRQLVSEIPEVG